MTSSESVGSVGQALSICVRFRVIDNLIIEVHIAVLVWEVAVDLYRLLRPVKELMPLIADQTLFPESIVGVEQLPHLSS